MDKLKNGEIIPGKNIGTFHLGWTFKQLKTALNDKFEIEKRSRCFVVKTDCIWFWLDDKQEEVFQIRVQEPFEGKFLGEIGIGSTLLDVENKAGEWQEELDVYILPNHIGICFELRDIDDFDDEWDELTAPINAISVY
ncbi:hypothetical protein V7157_26535 [Neobacillus drentensis]|uniref:hypothetical protein n=1 Tax=Neobacillus drentensis TaxID=220684 RepID=UPI003002BBC3